MEIKKNLVLLGMMGVGKTRIGKYVAKRLKINFFDIDKLVEKKNEMKITEIFKTKGEIYFRTESPRGDFGVYLVSDGSDKPYRVKVRAPSFANLQSLQYLLKGAYIADAVTILGSIDIIMGEVDR